MSKWALIARFPTECDVEFVKVHLERGWVRCSCREFVVSIVARKFECKHTLFCKEFVLDQHGAVELVEPKIPDAVAGADEHILRLWVERHVVSYSPEDMEKIIQQEGDVDGYPDR